MRYHGNRQIDSKSDEPSASYRYLDWICFGERARSRATSRAKSRTASSGGAATLEGIRLLAVDGSALGFDSAELYASRTVRNVAYTYG